MIIEFHKINEAFKNMLDNIRNELNSNKTHIISAEEKENFLKTLKHMRYSILVLSRIPITETYAEKCKEVFKKLRDKICWLSKPCQQLYDQKFKLMLAENNELAAFLEEFTLAPLKLESTNSFLRSKESNSLQPSNAVLENKIKEAFYTKAAFLSSPISNEAKGPYPGKDDVAKRNLTELDKISFKELNDQANVTQAQAGHPFIAFKR